MTGRAQRCVADHVFLLGTAVRRLDIEPMTDQYTDAEVAQNRRRLSLAFAASLVSAPGLWALGAPRYALASFLCVVITGVMLWGPTVQRTPPNRSKPTTVASTFSWIVASVGFATMAFVLLPHPRAAAAAAIWAVAMTVACVWIGRWPRAKPPLVA